MRLKIVVVLILCLIKIAIAGVNNETLAEKVIPGYQHVMRIPRNEKKDNELENSGVAKTDGVQSEFLKLAEKRGYGTEQHKVTTEDGYNLQIFRIPSSAASPKASGKPVVLIQHGLGVSSDSWIFMNRSLGFFLADVGYDVWLGNCRGNMYARSHTTLTPEEPRFWNYSWHEIGKIDYPTTIDYILKTTNKNTLTLIGLSMGGTAEMVLLSERPEYNKKINAAVAMAPAVFWVHESPIRVFLSAIYKLKDKIDPEGMSEIMGVNDSSTKLMEICAKHNILNLCLAALEISMSNGSEQTDLTVIASIGSKMASGISTKCIWHYCQQSKTGEFRQYDYGYEDNIQHYGQGEAPKYKLDNIATNMLIMYGNNDPYCSVEEVRTLISQLKNANTQVYNVEYDKFSHIDFAIAKDVKTLVHDQLLNFISKYKD